MGCPEEDIPVAMPSRQEWGLEGRSEVFPSGLGLLGDSEEGGVLRGIIFRVRRGTYEQD